ncbi:MAG: hypothetical protein IJM14_06885 [Lachnospiraceae bacterium]|nr:hypothetical protein [Lachnospiraceae bacterium]
MSDDFDERPDDEDLVDTDLEEDDEYVYEPVEAEIYQIIREDDEYDPDDDDEEDDDYPEDEEDDEPDEKDDDEPDRAEIIDFSEAVRAKEEKNDEKNHESRLKSFIKSHIRDIIAYAVVLLILSAAVIAGLYLRSKADRSEAGLMGKRKGNLTPAVEIATIGDAARESHATPATAETAEKESR